MPLGKAFDHNSKRKGKPVDCAGGFSVVFLTIHHLMGFIQYI